MNLAELMTAGGFVSEVPVKKEIVWARKGPDGADTETKFDVFVRRQSFGAIEVIYGNETDRSKMARYICESIRLGDKGTDEIPYEKAVMLDPALGTLLVKAINEVNGIGSAAPKN